MYQNIVQDNQNKNASLSASYIEPLNRKQSLEFNYGYRRQVTGNNRENYLVDPVTGQLTYVDSLSNIFDNTYITNRFGVNFRTNEKKFNYSIGLAVQPATIETNSLTGTIGNPNLLPEFNNVFSLRYNNFDFISGNVFFGNLTASFTNDKIVSNVANKGFGVQETRYLNSDGYYTVSGFYNMSRPFQNRKYVVSLGGS